MIRLFLDSGMRRGELAGLRVEDVDLDQEAAVVMGKGRRPQACPFGHTTGQALDRYMRARATRADASEAWLWLGKRGRLTETGVEQAVKRRGRAAGLPDIHAHQFRHTYAHQWLGASAADERPRGIQEAQPRRSSIEGSMSMPRVAQQYATERSSSSSGTLRPSDASIGAESTGAIPTRLGVPLPFDAVWEA